MRRRRETIPIRAFCRRYVGRPLDIVDLCRHSTSLFRCRTAASYAFQGQYGDVRLQGGREHSFLRHTEREDDMPESTYNVIQLIGTSNESWEKAAANAVEQAAKSLRDLRIAEVVELDMQLDSKGKVETYRAKVKVSFKYQAKS